MICNLKVHRIQKVRTYKRNDLAQQDMGYKPNPKGENPRNRKKIIGQDQVTELSMSVLLLGIIK